jgi:hypothetical protein
MTESEKAKAFAAEIRTRLIDTVVALLDNGIPEVTIQTVLDNCLKAGVADHARRNLVDGLLGGVGDPSKPAERRKPREPRRWPIPGSPESEFAKELAKAL